MCSAFFGGLGNSFSVGFRLYCRYNKREERVVYSVPPLWHPAGAAGPDGDGESLPGLDARGPAGLSEGNPGHEPSDRRLH